MRSVWFSTRGDEDLHLLPIAFRSRHYFPGNRVEVSFAHSEVDVYFHSTFESGNWKKWDLIR